MKFPFQTGETLELTAEGIDSSGHGVGSSGGIAIHAPNWLPGEIAEIRITNLSKHHPKAWGTVVELKSKSDQRVKPICPTRHCAGCHWQHWSYPAQLQEKSRIVSEFLGQHVKCVGSPLNRGYRNSAKFVPFEVNGVWLLGNRTLGGGAFVNTLKCEALDPVLKIAAEQLLYILREQELMHLLKYVALRVGNGDCIATLVSEAPLPSGISMEDASGLSGVVSHINKRTDGAVFDAAGPFTALSGSLTISFPLANDSTVKVPPAAFWQVNTKQSLALQNHVAKLIQKEDRVVDYFGGVGAYALNLDCKAITIVETNESAVAAAKNAATNQDRRINVICSDSASAEASGNVFIVNPPRAGLRKMTAVIEQKAPERIVYVSCNPKSLASDLKKMPSYQLDYATAYDMMPNTPHVETVALLVRRKPTPST